VQTVAGARSGRPLELARRGFRSCLFDGSREQTPVYDWDRIEPGHRLSGPALIDDRTTTVLVPRGFGCAIDEEGNLLLEPETARAAGQTTSSRGEDLCRASIPSIA
jgi:N-methylhydantoinase A/oxoprolinase/acetone carboxylase beta subunit